jgi:hypothetical protein
MREKEGAAGAAPSFFSVRQARRISDRELGAMHATRPDEKGDANQHEREDAPPTDQRRAPVKARLYSRRSRWDS